MQSNWDGRLRANAFEIPLADESVHMIVTSPPYYSLRKYEIPAMVIGGDQDCEHEWSEWSELSELSELSDVREISKDGTKSRTTSRYYGDPSRKFDGNHQKHTAGQVCKLCDAYYGWLGLEPTMWMYLEHMVLVFDELWRVLRKDGVVFLNIGDSYANSGGRGAQGITSQRRGRNDVIAQMKQTSQTPSPGLKAKDMNGIPFRLVLALQDRGWYWRSTIVWHKSNCMPGSQQDRPTSSWEPVFLLSKSERYHYDHIAIMEPVSGNAHPRGNGAGPKTVDGQGQHRNNQSFSTVVKDIVYSRNKRDVWTVPSEPLTEEHYAAFPQSLVETCVLAGTSDYNCADCAAPYKRILAKQFWGDWHGDQELKKEGVNRNHANGAKWRKMQEQASGHRMVNSVQAQRDAGAPHDFLFLPPKTIGWQKTCKCSTWKRQSAIVLDPFGGSGTTARVAKRLFRRWILLDLGYQEMQGRRVSNVQPQLTDLHT